MNFVQLGRTGTFNSKSFTNILFLNKNGWKGSFFQASNWWYCAEKWSACGEILSTCLREKETFNIGMFTSSTFLNII